jgi:hypothetical protein
MKCPCRGCADRKLGCHGVCEPYKTWKVWFEKKKLWIWQQGPGAVATGNKRKNVTEWLRKIARGTIKSHGAGNGGIGE